jgi:cyanophycinase
MVRYPLNFPPQFAYPEILPSIVQIGLVGTLVCSQALLLVAELPRQHPAGTLILCGGGKPYNADVLDTFFECAGGTNAKIVVVPTAHPDMDDDKKNSNRISLLSDPWSERGAHSIVVRHTLDREEADSIDFCRAIDEATGVWIGGGDQSRLCETYQGTRFSQSLLALYQRGGVIGGTSAGTAIQSEWTIVGDNDRTTQLRKGFACLPGTIVDQHFLARNRTDRLVRALQQKPGLIGIGIDEYTAAVIHQNQLTVVGASIVTLFQPIDGKTTFQTLKLSRDAAPFQLAVSRTKL